MAGGSGFVDVDAQSGAVIGPEHAVADLRGAGEDLPRPLREAMAVLDPEIRHGEVEMQIGRVPDRRDVAGTVPGGAHPKELAQRGELAGRGDAADVREMDPDEVDQPLLDQR